MAALALATAAAQEPPRVVAVHHQAVLFEEGRSGPLVAEVRLPSLRAGAWDAVTAESDAPCLEPLAVRPADDGVALALEVAVRGARGGPLEPGESCLASVVLRFAGSAASEAVAVRAAFHRPAAPARAGPGLAATIALDRIGRGEAGPGATHPPAPYMELALRNDGAESVRVVGVASLDALRELGFEAFLFPAGGRPGSLTGLSPLTGDLGVWLGAGRTLRLGIVFDPAARLPQDAGAVTLQPALLVEEGGRLLSVAFDMASTVWGAGSP